MFNAKDQPLSNCKQSLMHLFCGAGRCNFNLLRDKRGWISALLKSLRKGVLKNEFVYVETSDENLLYQLRSKQSIHQRDFDLKYTQVILFLHIAWFLYHYSQCLRP